MKIARRMPKCEVPSTAMGDIAFNLLIFFVILARAQDDSDKVWQPAVTSKVESAGFSPASVLVDKDQKLYLNGAEIGEQQLAKEIEDLLGNSPAGQRTVLLKIDRGATAQRFEPVIEAVSQAGGEIVHVLEEEKPK